MKTNYKGFELTYSLDKYDNIIIEEVEGSVTNQIALLTQCMWNSFQDANRVEAYTVELDYKIIDSFNNYGCDFGISIEKWLLTDVKEQQRILIELLTLETAEIEEQIGEKV